MANSNDDRLTTYCTVSHAEIEGLRVTINSLDWYIQQSALSGLEQTAGDWIHLKKEGAGFWDVLNQISHPLPNELPVTSQCAETLKQVIDMMSGGPRGNFILKLQRELEASREYFSKRCTTEWEELTPDQKEICLLTAAVRAWEGKTKMWKRLVDPDNDRSRIEPEEE